MSVDVDTADAFSARMDAFTHIPVLPRIWEGINASPPVSGTWLSLQMFRNENHRLGIDPALMQHQGFFQVSVMAPSNVGPRASDLIAGAVQDHFPADLAVGPARVTATPSIANGFPDRNWWRTPVSIYYEILT